MNYLDELNESQKKAVIHGEGPLMVLAGAGSGKTRVLAYRIAHLINNYVDPFNILSLTFTNKAAREMKARIAKIIGESESRNIWMGTFHSVFAKILRIESEKIGYPSNFTIYDTEDTKNLLKTIIKELSLDDKIYKVSSIYGRISSAKSNLINANQYQRNPTLVNEDRASGRPLIGEIFAKYEKRCFKAAAMDFDDLLFKTNILLRDHPDVLYKYQEKFKFILVDEFQDTNYSQFIILKQLAARHENICVVGDDAQSIYAFRGANIENILNFSKTYPDTVTYKLEQNYRSTQTIVNAANSIIEQNKNQYKKNVWTSNVEGEKIKLISAMSDNEEAQLVANEILETKHQYKVQPDNFAILYRTNAQSRTLEEALRRRDIPYRIFGGLSFYQRKEVKDLLAYCRLTINPMDEEALKRIINYPVRGIGKTSLDKIILFAEENSQSLWWVLENCQHPSLKFNSGTQKKLLEFVTMVKSFAARANKESAYDLGNRIASSSGILRDLYADKSPEGLSRYENIQELLAAFKDFSDQEDVAEESKTLATFLQDVALITDQDTKDDDTQPKVSLMTVHAAKGLEFPYVFIVGMEENLFPSQLSISTREDLEEERRLFYVALTRAEKRAFISYAASRFRWGNVTYCEPSRFIQEIKPEFIQSSIAERLSASTRDNYASGNSNYSFPKRKLVALNKAEGSFSGDDTSNLKQGDKVEHQRFGEGIVISLEGENPNKKASINFNSFGEKQLLLKFAKLKML